MANIFPSMHNTRQSHILIFHEISTLSFGGIFLHTQCWLPTPTVLFLVPCKNFNVCVCVCVCVLF